MHGQQNIKKSQLVSSRVQPQSEDTDAQTSLFEYLN